jgi:23S rRNA pseudouridine1911/1915/1917 synthase
MKEVPFYGNLKDKKHCTVAVYKMLFEYFQHRELSWEEAEALSGFQPGKSAWTVTIWERMSRLGYDIRMIENFDYQRYAKKGKDYLKEYFTPAEYEWQLKNTNIEEIVPYMDAFLQAVSPEQRRPKLQDIDDMLAEDRLIFMTLNSRVLNDHEGFASHAVLVIEKDGDGYIIHDPGGSTDSHPYRRVPAEKLWQAMGADESTSEVTGLKLKKETVRADVALARLYPEYSRAALAKLFDKGLVKAKGKVLKAGDKLHADTPPEADLTSLREAVLDIDLPIMYEDDDCVVINKPAGVLTHALGVHGNEASVASFLRSKVTGIEGDRAGVVHRLDRPTSGVIIGARHQEALSWLQKQFSLRKVKKTYTAVVKGMLKQDEAVIDMPIERNPKAPATFRVAPNGKSAVTHYKVLRSNGKYSLVELRPETGRTHQLRVHLAKIGHPIVGDALYGTGKFGDRLFLHAHSLEITLPSKERRTFTAPLPPEFEEQVK